MARLRVDSPPVPALLPPPHRPRAPWRVGALALGLALSGVLPGGLAACHGAGPGDAPKDTQDSGPVDTGESAAPSRCGDGVLDPQEGCDDGAANSDTEPGACRTDCLPARCGDAVTDPGEACDDGGTWGGDGCDPACAAEAGAPESEPNNTPAEADPGAPGVVNGALPADDVDCWALEVPACGAVSAVQTGACDVPLSLSLHDPSGAEVAAGGPGGDGCARLDPAEEPGARWVAGGTWALCVAAVASPEVRGYTLTLDTPDPAGLDAPAMGGDLDGDAVPDSCDADDDADGVPDAEDNCPEVSNGPDTPAPALSAAGFVRHWLAAGPYTTGASTGHCRPSEDNFVGEDAPISPRLGDDAGGVPWTGHLLSGDSFDLLPDYGWVGAPREAYSLVYLHSDTERAATLSLGADDGVFAWWNGELVVDVASCQGVYADQFQAPVTVVAGWNQLLLKVRDQGGGWGLAARLLDEGGAPLTDLEPSFVPEAGWAPDQSDRDGDGVGDVCDPSP